MRPRPNLTMESRQGWRRQGLVAQSLIVTAGFFWAEASVEWGGPGKKGQLRGVLNTAKRATPIDFSDQVGVYALYADYSLVYVGQTGKGEQALLKRLREHRRDDLAGRWNRFSWFGVRRVLETGSLSKKNGAFHPSLIDVLDQVEGVLIHIAEPALNRQGGRLKKTVKRYLQDSPSAKPPTNHPSRRRKRRRGSTPLRSRQR